MITFQGKHTPIRGAIEMNKLAFPTKTTQLGGTLQHSTSLIGKLTSYQRDPSDQNSNSSHSLVTKVKDILIKLVKHRNKYESHWYALSDDGNNSFIKLIGIEYDVCMLLMIHLGLCMHKNETTSPQKTCSRDGWMLTMCSTTC